MDTYKETVIVEKSVRVRNSRALIEGNAKLPEGFGEIGGVLEAGAVCEVLSASCSSGSLNIEGKARFSVVYIDKSGEIRSFESECGFIHSAEDEEIVPGMRAFASAKLLECSAKSAEGGVFMRALVGIDAICVENEEIAAVTESSISDRSIEKLVTRTELPFLSAAEKKELYITAEAELPQNLPECAEILLSRAYAVLRRLTKEEGRLIFEGDIRFFVLYRSADKNSPVKFYSDTVEFGEIVQEENCTDDVFAELRLERLGISCENGSTFVVSAVLGVNYICTEWRGASFVSDAYSPLLDCETEKHELSYGTLHSGEIENRIFRLPFAIPESYPEAARVISAMGTAQIVKTECSGEKLTVQGLISASLCYATADAGLRNIRQNLPFELELNADEGAELIPFVKNISAEGAGYEFELKISLEFLVSHRSRRRTELLTKLSAVPAKAPAQPGIIVYYTGGEESAWDIAKHFRTNAAKLAEENGLLNISDAVPPGRKLTIIRS